MHWNYKRLECVITITAAEGAKMIIDTHAHYDDGQFDTDRDELLNSMHEGGIGLIVNAGSTLSHGGRFGN